MPCCSGPAGALSATVFFAQAARLASALPDAESVINLCETRHGFMVGFAAALLRGQVSLLPPVRGRIGLEALRRRHPGAYAMSEEPIAGADAFAVGAFLEDRAAGALRRPAHRPADAVAAVLFTSGSTGEPTAHPKTWGQLCRGARLLATALGWDVAAGGGHRGERAAAAHVRAREHGDAALAGGRPGACAASRSSPRTWKRPCASAAGRRGG